MFNKLATNLRHEPFSFGRMPDVRSTTASFVSKVNERINEAGEWFTNRAFGSLASR